jgi:hypothetical protein
VPKIFRKSYWLLITGCSLLVTGCWLVDPIIQGRKVVPGVWQPETSNKKPVTDFFVYVLGSLRFNLSMPG